MSEEKITVTSPLLPDLEEFNTLLREIWDSKWITNNGTFHKRLEAALAEYLKVPYVSLFTNGTLPLLTALQALRITGEVITTPYSFVATTHAIWWNGCKPVFVDIDPATGNIDPEKIEAAITPRTTAIMPVHVYGKPCRTAEIKAIADKYGLKVIYDAAHAFGVEVNGESILNAGDMSTLSFHATKVFNTIEGGAMVMHNAETKKRIDYLKNFGFANETTVVGPGINSKMDEIRSAFGLLNLKQVDAAIEARHQVAIRYREALKDIPGITFFEDMPKAFGYNDLNNDDFVKQYVDLIRSAVQELNACYDNFVERIENCVKQHLGFSDDVDYNEYKTLIENRFKCINKSLLAQKPRAFIDRALSPCMSKREFYEKIGQVVYDRRLETIKDNEEERFIYDLLYLFSEAERFIKVSSAFDENTDTAFSFELATSDSSFKVSKTYALPKTKRIAADEVAMQLMNNLSGDKDLDVCVLLKLLSERL